MIWREADGAISACIVAAARATPTSSHSISIVPASIGSRWVLISPAARRNADWRSATTRWARLPVLRRCGRRMSVGAILLWLGGIHRQFVSMTMKRSTPCVGVFLFDNHKFTNNYAMHRFQNCLTPAVHAATRPFCAGIRMRSRRRRNQHPPAPNRAGTIEIECELVGVARAAATIQPILRHQLPAKSCDSGMKMSLQSPGNFSASRLVHEFDIAHRVCGVVVQALSGLEIIFAMSSTPLRFSLVMRM